MRLDAVTVALRPRSSWEAVELGTALVRRHARAVWTPWFAATLPVFAIVNLACWALGATAAAMAVMWWLKPLFDRIPLFVLSRAVFGEVPAARATLRGAFRGGGRVAYLAWRRLSPARALLMPVDMLEGGPAARAGARRRALAGPAYGIAALCLLAFAHFEAAVLMGLAGLLFLFVPNEYVLTSLQVVWQHLRDAPTWLLVVENALAWAATSLLEPFYVGSGFGLYLNRRTQIEGWDIELVFRRLRARLLAAGGALAIAAVALLAPAPSHAMERCPRPADDAAALQRAFGPDWRDPADFRRAVDRAFEDERLHPRRQVTTWTPRHPSARPEAQPPRWLAAVARAFAAIGEGVLWLLAAALVLALALTARWWWPWLRGLQGDAPREAAPVRESAAAAPVPLPADVVAHARRLWAQGQGREALALVYRAAVEAMVAATGRVLPPGATEAQCLRASQALPDGARRTFAAVVRQWQYAAYAERLPADAAFDTTLRDAAAAFGWRA